ncbi:MAG: glycosyltransferase family 4 protein [Chloroflexi bacterium]|nr:MAG: glycosyltransferase family 4 protein [Chloroflexota bacterium]
MRIWIVNHYADPPAGHATRTFDLSRRLVEKGHPTTIFGCSFSHYYFRPFRKLGWRPWRDENMEGVTYVWVYGTPYKGNDWRRVLNMLVFSTLAFLAGLFRGGRPNIVVGVSVHPLGALVGYFLARVKRARFFFEITDLWPQSLIDFGMLRADSIAARSMRVLERFLFRRAERIIMLWRNTDEYVESQGVAREKILWVPHGVELSRYEDLEPYLGGSTSPFKIYFVGGFVAGNSLPTILDAAAELQRRGRSDVRFFLIGSGQDRDSIVERARTLGLQNVEFPPAVPKKDVAKVMNSADAFIYGLQDIPLYRFGVSMNKVTDYLAAGRPIVFFGNSTYDPVRNANAGFSVPPNDPGAIADAIEKLVALPPAERIEMGKRGRSYLVENHNIPRLADRLVEVFEGTRTPA